MYLVILEARELLGSNHVTLSDARGSLQQAGDTRLPAVSIHRQFKVLVEDRLDALFADGVRLVADHRATMPIGFAIGERRSERILIAIGPEGGWNAFELTLLQAHGFRQVGLGPRTLRVDTACTALLAIAHASITVQGRNRAPGNGESGCSR